MKIILHRIQCDDDNDDDDGDNDDNGSNGSSGDDSSNDKGKVNVISRGLNEFSIDSH